MGGTERKDETTILEDIDALVERAKNEWIAADRDCLSGKMDEDGLRAYRRANHICIALCGCQHELKVYR